MKHMHPQIATKILENWNRAERANLELVKLHELLRELNLTLLLDHTYELPYIWEDYYQPDWGADHVYPGRWHITIQIPYEAIDIARPILYELIDQIGPFEKHYHVAQFPHDYWRPALVETWRATWGEVTGKCTSTAANALAVEFYRDVVEGEQLTATCAVKRVAKEIVDTRPTGHLAVVCSKDGA